MKKLLYVLFIFLCLLACKRQQQVQQSQATNDLPQIMVREELVVLTLNSPVSYFNYRGQDMGFQYELAGQYAKKLGLTLQVKIGKSISELLDMLAAGEGDLIAYNVPITRELKDSVLFCGEETVTHQVIVQRKNRDNLLTDVTQLIGKEVHVKPGKYYDRLVNLNDELGGGIIIHEENNDSVSIDDLIMQVSNGKILYTVCDNDLAQLNKTYYSNLNVNLAISYDQRSSWVVRKDSPLLADDINKWYTENKTSPDFEASAKRYFEINKGMPYTPILSLQDGKISQYDDIFRKYAPEINWDWRLLASLAYTESNFDTTVVSWAGARGLMQLMPATAHAMGVPEGMEHDPEESVKAAMKYIASTTRSLRSVPDETERIRFVLGAYNAGLGHIYDAMALAEKYGSDRTVWYDNVEKYILLKSNEKYYNDPVCKHGYFHGVQTYNFVRDIDSRFQIYKSKVRE